MRPSHGPGFVAVSKGAFDEFSAFLQQLLAVVAPDPPSIAVDGLLLLCFMFPVPPSALRFRNVSSHLRLSQRHHGSAAVIAFVGHYLRDSVEMNLRFRFRRLLHFPLDQP